MRMNAHRSHVVTVFMVLQTRESKESMYEKTLVNTGECFFFIIQDEE